MNNKTTTTIFVILCIVITTLMIILYNIGIKTNSIINNQNIILNDTIEHYINNNNEQVSKVKTLEATNSKYIININTKDKNIIKLQKLIKNYETTNKKLSVAIIIKNNMIANYNDSIKNIISNTYNININDTIYVYPTYNRKLDMFDNWITGNIKLGYNTTDFNICTYSEYDITIGQERKNIFSKYNTFTTITNRNPYDKTRNVRVFNKLKTNKRWVVTTSAVYGMNDNGLGMTVGIGIGYILIYLW